MEIQDPVHPVILSKNLFSDPRESAFNPRHPRPIVSNNEDCQDKLGRSPRQRFRPWKKLSPS
jgi:hypothetical protein